MQQWRTQQVTSRWWYRGINVIGSQTCSAWTAVAGSDCDWVLDLVATGFSKPVQQFGPTLTTPAEVFAVADAFCEQHLQVWLCSYVIFVQS